MSTELSALDAPLPLHDEQGRFIREGAKQPRSPPASEAEGSTSRKILDADDDCSRASEQTALNSVGAGHTLNEAILEVTTNQAKEAPTTAIAMRLFYNSRTFESELNQKHTYYCDLSNIHCHLSVKVRWKEGAQELDGAYQLKAISCGTSV